MTAEPVLTPAAAEAAPPPAPGFRRAMGEFASGVTVVTAADAEGPVGFACQSFASVSLDPPLVLFCAGHGGRSWPRIRAAGRFCVNVLGEEQPDLCRRFGSAGGEKFAGLGWDPSRWGAPALRGVLLRVHGEIQDVHAAGDHDVVIGRVLETEIGEGAAGDGARPMLFFRGAFGIDRSPFPADPAAAAALWEFGDRWG